MSLDLMTNIVRKWMYVFKFDQKNIMIKINPKSSDVDSLKSSILISLHYYEISFHPERILNLKTFEKRYNFIHITLTEFETSKLNISLAIFDEDNNKKYITERILLLIKHT